MNRNLPVFAIIGMVFIGISAWFGIQTEPLPDTRNTNSRLEHISILENFTYRSYNNDLLVKILEADELLVTPRRVFVFNVNNVNEFTMHNARFNVYLHGNSESDMNPFSLLETSLASNTEQGGHTELSLPKEFGHITRAVIVNLIQNIYSDNVLKAVITARRAHFNKQDGKPEYLAVTLFDTKSANKIICKKALWNKDKNRFEIPGPYMLVSANNLERGRDIAVNLDFAIETM